MRPVGVVVVDIEVHDPCEVAAPEDEDPVEALATHGADEAFGVGVRPWCLDWGADHVEAFGSEHLVEVAAELGVAVAAQETS